MGPKETQLELWVNEAAETVSTEDWSIVGVAIPPEFRAFLANAGIQDPRSLTKVLIEAIIRASTGSDLAETDWRFAMSASIVGLLKHLDTKALRAVYDVTLELTQKSKTDKSA